MTINPQAIIFDCDGVLIDSERIGIAVEREHLARLGLDYDFENYVTRFVGLRDGDFYDAIKADHAALERGPFPADFEEKVLEEKWQRFEAELEAIDGIHAFLDMLSMPIAVASSSGVASLDKKLRLTDLHARFDPHIYSGETVANGKPAPDLFLLAAAQLGVAPDRCIVIEDSINGVRAGRAADMLVWGFAGGGHADPGLGGRLEAAGAHHTFHGYADMIKHWQVLAGSSGAS